MSKRESGHGGTAPDPDEVGKFEAMAEDVWDPAGPMRPLHRLNPLRIAYIREQAHAVLGTPGATLAPAVRGPRPRPISLWRRPPRRAHGAAGCRGHRHRPLPRRDRGGKGACRGRRARDRYQRLPGRALAEEGALFDIVLAMEVIEHTVDPDLFIAELADITRPGGLLVLSTLNRTIKSYALAILGAEYILRWLPRGTHDWRRFIPPAMLARLLRRRGFRVIDTTGVTWRPHRNDFARTRDRDVNYMLSAVRD
jgi:2-polyprenyl-6-hydroxyphenyl methylase/3-demethylubiquinone-9 3-methyltransferase